MPSVLLHDVDGLPAAHVAFILAVLLAELEVLLYEVGAQSVRVEASPWRVNGVLQQRFRLTGEIDICSIRKGGILAALRLSSLEE